MGHPMGCNFRVNLKQLLTTPGATSTPLKNPMSSRARGLVYRLSYIRIPVNFIFLKTGPRRHERKKKAEIIFCFFVQIFVKRYDEKPEVTHRRQKKKKEGLDNDNMASHSCQPQRYVFVIKNNGIWERIEPRTSDFFPSHCAMNFPIFFSSHQITAQFRSVNC